MNHTRENPIDPELGEQLSALMDGELDEAQSRFLLRRLAHDPALQATWERWQLASGSLRGQLRLQVDAGFLARVRVGAAAPEPLAATGTDAAGAGRRSSGGGWLRWVAGGAVAASVAVVALVWVDPSRDLAPAGQGSELVASPAVQPTVAPSPLSESDLRPRLRNPADTVAAMQRAPLVLRPEAQPPVDPRLAPYLILHDPQRSAQGLGGFLPYVEAVEHPPAARRSGWLVEDAHAPPPR